MSLNNSNSSSDFEVASPQGSPLDNDYTLYDEYIAGKAIWKTVPPFMIIFGTLGNILSIIVLTRKNIRKSTSSVYLVVLACSDLLVLYTGLLRQWIIATFEVDIRLFGFIICKIHAWLLYVSLDFSSWILVAVTAERVALVWFPHKAKSRCTKREAFWVLTSLGLSMMIINSHLLYGLTDVTVTDNNVTTIKRCKYLNKNYDEFFNYVWPWIDFVMFSGLPFVLLVIGNTLIIAKVVSNQRAVHRQVAPHNQQRRFKNTVSSMSVMLITLNTVFIICTAPISAYLIGAEHWYMRASMKDLAILSLSWSVVNVLMYTNNTINFLLYCLSGSKFRSEVKSMVYKVIGVERHNAATTQRQLDMEATHRSEINLAIVSTVRGNASSAERRDENPSSVPCSASRSALDSINEKF